MVLAMAVLLFQIAPATQALSQRDAAATVESSAPVLLAENLPSADPTVASPAAVSTDSTPAKSPQQGTADKEAGSSSAIASAANADSLHAALQNSQALATIRVADAYAKPARFVSAEPPPSRASWIALSLAQHAAAAFDAYSTRDAISRGAVEQDPLIRPFANSSAIYAAIQVGPVALDLLGRHLQRSDNTVFRRTWWVPQALSTGMYFISGVHNIHVANRE